MNKGVHISQVVDAVGALSSANTKAGLAFAALTGNAFIVLLDCALWGIGAMTPTYVTFAGHGVIQVVFLGIGWLVLRSGKRKADALMTPEDE